VQFANGVAARLMGKKLEPGEELPEPWPDLSLRELIAGLLVPGSQVAEARTSFDDARSVSIVALPPAPGTATVILVLSDVTARERQERAEREFVTNAAHELRTPLAAIASAVEALNDGAKEDPAERDRFLDVVDRQTARLGRLARALLVLARAQTREEPVTLQPIELRPLLQEVAAGVRTRDGVALEVDCPDGLTALAQRDLIEQVMANLAANAAKHTDRGLIRLGASRRGERAVTVEVSDTGTGIDPAVQGRVYDRFFVAGGDSRDGFGLGLAIVRESVRALGGLIEIDSRPGAGTTARVTLGEGEPTS
jgi:signal transduction histidine kinase